jgi:type I restriction enzyme R subunit
LLNKEKPDISILSEDFLNQIKEIKQKNYAVELLAKLLNDEIKVKMRKNPHRYKSLYERLKELIEKYNAKTLEASEIIEKLVEIARELREKIQEGKRLDLTEEELAFYDMLLRKMSTFGLHRLDWLIVCKRFPWNAKYETVYRWLASFIVIYTIMNLKS